MSILIKGMKLPSDGTYTINVHVVNGKAIVRKLDKNGFGTYEAIEIPTPHGRLIDTDKVVEEIVEAVPWHMDKSNSIYVDGLVRADEIIENAQTVIEREE